MSLGLGAGCDDLGSTDDEIFELEASTESDGGDDESGDGETESGSEDTGSESGDDESSDGELDSMCGQAVFDEDGITEAMAGEPCDDASPLGEVGDVIEAGAPATDSASNGAGHGDQWEPS